MNWPCKTLQNLPYFWAYQNLGSFLLFFKVVYFSLMNALDGLWLLAMQFISENIKYVKRSISLEHFFKHKPPNSEEWFILPNFLLFGKQILIRKKKITKNILLLTRQEIRGIISPSLYTELISRGSLSDYCPWLWKWNYKNKLVSKQLTSSGMRALNFGNLVVDWIYIYSIS